MRWATAESVADRVGGVDAPVPAIAEDEDSLPSLIISLAEEAALKLR
jgi:hypothetical protein